MLDKLLALFGYGKLDRLERKNPSRNPVIAGLNLQLADEAVISHELGRFKLSSQVGKALDRDDRTNACFNTRELAVQGLDFSFTDPLYGKNNRRARKALERDFPQMFPVSIWGEIIRNVGMFGFCVARLNWNTPVPTIQIWDPYYVTYNFDKRQFMAECVWTDKSGIQHRAEVPVTAGDGNWLLFLGRNHSQPYMGGLIRILPQLVVFRQSNMLDWSKNGKIWGNPPKVVSTTDARAGKIDDYEKLALKMKEICGNDIITLPNGATISLLELSRDAYRVFQAFGPEFLDDCIAIAILGQNLTTKVKGASLAATTGHNLVRQDYMEGDCRTLGDTAYSQIALPYYYYKFGIAELDQVPNPTWDAVPPNDAETKAKARKAKGESWSALAKGIRDLRGVGIIVNRESICKDEGIQVISIGDFEPEDTQPPGGAPALPPAEEDDPAEDDSASE